MLSENRARFPKCHGGCICHSVEIVRPAFLPEPRSLAGLGLLTKRWHAVHVGAVGFLIDQPASEESFALIGQTPPYSCFCDTDDKARRVRE